MTDRFAKLKRRQLDDAARRFPVDSASPRSGWVRAMREALGMSQAQLATRAGISRATVQKLELAEGRRRITLDSLDRLAAALGCQVAIALVPHGGSLEGLREHAANAKAETLLCFAAAAAAEEAELQRRFLIKPRDPAQTSAQRAHAMRRSQTHFKCDNSAKV